jgi:hypothetical protein
MLAHTLLGQPRRHGGGRLDASFEPGRPALGADSYTAALR